MPLYLRITQQDVGFHKTDPGIIDPKSKPDLNNYIFPSLRQDDVVEYLGVTKNQWVHIRRTRIVIINGNKTEVAEEGFVDWRYTELMVPLEEISIAAKQRRHLSAAEKYAVATFIEYLLVTPTPDNRTETLFDLFKRFFPNDISKIEYLSEILKYIAPFWRKSLKWLSPDETAIAIYTVLRPVAENAPCEDFADIVLKLKIDNLFLRLVKIIDVDHLEEHHRVISRILFMLTFLELEALIKQTVLDEVVKKTFPNAIAKLTELAPLNAPFTLLKEGIHLYIKLHQLLKRLFGDPEHIGYEAEVFLRMRMHEVRFWLNKDEEQQVNLILLDLMALLDKIISLLFGNDEDNPLFAILGFDNEYLQKIWKKSGRDLWNYFRRPIDKNLIASNMVLSAETDASGITRRARNSMPTLKDVYDYDNNQLLVPLPALQHYTPGAVVPSESTVTKPDADDGQNVSELVKASIFAVAAHLHQFLYSDAMKVLLDAPPNLIHYINARLKNIIRPWVSKNLLSTGVRGINDNTSALGLNSDNNNVADLIEWKDLARIWFYQLGSVTELSPLEVSAKVEDPIREKVLLFNGDAVSTKLIKQHPLFDLILSYTHCRIQNDEGTENGWSPFSIYLHYNFDVLLSSLSSYDTTLNLLGSFTLLVTPNKLNNKIEFQLINNLSIDSGTRFRRNPKNGKNIVGIIQSHDRNYNTVLKNAQKKGLRKSERELIDLGGTLMCIWQWNENN